MCVCPDGQELYDGKCVDKCFPTQTRHVDGVCVCINTKELYNGLCVDRCIDGSGTTRNSDGVCVCPNDQELYYGRCLKKCLPTQIRNNNGVCVCPNGQDIFNGSCIAKCLPNQTRDSNGLCVSRCFPGTVVNNDGICVCPDGQELYNGKCVPKCSFYFKRNSNGECVCPDDSEIVNRLCVKKCLSGSVRKNSDYWCTCTGVGECKCPFGTYFDKVLQNCRDIECPDWPNEWRVLDGNCECKAGAVRDSSGKCACPSTSKFNSMGYCECPIPGQSIINGACSCSSGYTLISNEIGCKKNCTIPGQTLTSYGCQCDGYNELVDNKCVPPCPLYSKRIGAECVCNPNYLKQPDGTCIPKPSENNEMIKTYLHGNLVCKDETKINIGGKCILQCPAGQFNKDGGCAKCENLYNGKCSEKCPLGYHREWWASQLCKIGELMD